MPSLRDKGASRRALARDCWGERLDESLLSVAAEVAVARRRKSFGVRSARWAGQLLSFRRSGLPSSASALKTAIGGLVMRCSSEYFSNSIPA